MYVKWQLKHPWSLSLYIYGHRQVQKINPSIVVSRWHIVTQNAEYPFTSATQPYLKIHLLTRCANATCSSGRGTNPFMTESPFLSSVIQNRFATVFFITFIPPFSLCVYVIAVIYFFKYKNDFTLCTLYSGPMPSLTSFLSTRQTGLDPGISPSMHWNQNRSWTWNDFESRIDSESFCFRNRMEWWDTEGFTQTVSVHYYNYRGVIDGTIGRGYISATLCPQWGKQCEGC